MTAVFGRRAFHPSTLRRVWLVVLGFAIAAECVRAEAAWAGRDSRTSRPLSIYVMSHGWHTGIVVRQADIPAGCGWPALPEFARDEFLEIGWGSEPFYTARKFQLGVALRTVFTLTPSVVHAVGFREPPAQRFWRAELVRLEISAGALRTLCAHLGATFARDACGALTDLGPGLYGHSRFYRANGRYCLPSNCNAWTARTLRAGGYPVHGPSTLIAGRLMAQVRALRPVHRAQPVTNRNESPPNGRAHRVLRPR